MTRGALSRRETDLRKGDQTFTEKFEHIADELDSIGGKVDSLVVEVGSLRQEFNSEMGHLRSDVTKDVSDLKVELMQKLASTNGKIDSILELLRK